MLAEIQVMRDYIPYQIQLSLQSNYCWDPQAIDFKQEIVVFTFELPLDPFCSVLHHFRTNIVAESYGYIAYVTQCATCHKPQLMT